MSYDAAFYTENARIGLESAEIMLPAVLEVTRATNVIDIGCGSGAWLSVAKAHGCTVKGIDRNTPDSHLLIDSTEFERRDLTEGVDCTGYDLAMCLEVAEHLPESSAKALVNGLCKARFVLFSAAIPGQRGVDHINEQWSTWWEPFFEANGYDGSSALRWRFWTDRRIANFYRQNVLVFADWNDLDRAELAYSPVVDVVHPERLGIW